MKNINNYIKIAEEFAKMSHCVSKKVGCVIIKNDRIISTGVNGTLPGFLNCCDFFNSHDFNREEHSTWSNIFELHAEQSAIANAVKNGININDSIAVVTLQPCMSCLKLLVFCGIKEIYFSNFYDRINVDTNLLNNFIKASNIIYKKI